MIPSRFIRIPLFLLLATLIGCQEAPEERQAEIVEQPAAPSKPTAAPNATQLEPISPTVQFSRQLDDLKNLPSKRDPSETDLASARAVIAAYKRAAILTPSLWKDVHDLAQTARSAVPDDPYFNLAYVQAIMAKPRANDTIDPNRMPLPDTPAATYYRALSLIPVEPGAAMPPVFHKHVATLMAHDPGDAAIYAVDLSLRSRLITKVSQTPAQHSQVRRQLATALPFASEEVLPIALRLWIQLAEPGSAAPAPIETSIVKTLLYAPLGTPRIDDLKRIANTQAIDPLDVPMLTAARALAAAHLAVIAPTEDSAEPWLPAEFGKRSFFVFNDAPSSIPSIWHFNASVQEALRATDSDIPTAALELVEKLDPIIIQGTPLDQALTRNRILNLTKIATLPQSSQLAVDFHRGSLNGPSTAEIQKRLSTIGLKLDDTAALAGHSDSFYQRQLNPHTLRAIQETTAALKQYPDEPILKDALAQLLLARVLNLSKRSGQSAKEELSSLLPTLAESSLKPLLAARLAWHEKKYDQAYGLVINGLETYPEDVELTALALQMEHALNKPMAVSARHVAQLKRIAGSDKWLAMKPLPRLLLAHGLRNGFESKAIDLKPAEQGARTPKSNDPSAWIRFGLAQEQTNRHTRASEAFQRAIELQPRSLATRRSYAAYRWRIGDRTRSTTIREQALANATAPVDAYLVFLNDYMEKLESDNPKKALAMRLRLEELTPNQVSNHRAIAKLLISLAENPLAHNLAKRLHKQDPDDPAAMILLAQSAPSDAPQAYFIDLANTVTKGQKRNPERWLAATAILACGDDPRVVETCYRKAVSQETSRPKHFNAYVSWLNQTVSDDETIQHLEDLCADGRSYACAFLAKRALEAHDFITASRILDTLDDAAIHLDILRGQLHNATEKPEQALTIAAKIIQRAPESIDGYLIQAQAFLLQGSTTGARAALKTAAQLEKQNVTYRLLLAQVELADDKTHHAIRVLQEAATLAPEDAETRRMLAQALLDTNRLDDLYSLLDATISTRQPSPIWHRFYAQGLASERQTTNAATMWYEAFQIGRDPADLANAIRQNPNFTLPKSTDTCYMEEAISRIEGSQPNQPAPHITAAQTALDQGKIMDAHAALAELSIDDAEGWILKSYVQAIVGVQEATESAEIALTAAGQNRILQARALTNAGYANLRIGNLAAARRQFDKALEAHPMSITFLHLAHLSFLNDEREPAASFLEKAEKTKHATTAYVRQEQIDAMKAQLRLKEHAQ